MKALPDPKNTQQIHGYIERITYQNPENGYTVAQLQEPNKRKLTTVVGMMPSVRPGETVRCEGEWKNHLIHGSQFEMVSIKIETPADLQGIKKYLSSGLIKGIGEAYAERIVAKFGLETLHVIDENPQALNAVEGIGPKRMQQIISCWSDQKSIRDVMIFLQQYQVSSLYAQKIFKTYGDKAIEKMRENPYCLATDIYGIGFKSADKIAKEMGMDAHAPQRIDAGIEYVISKLSDDGHVCHPVEEFIPIAQEILVVAKDEITARLDFLHFEDRIVIKDLLHEQKMTPFLWLKALYRSEKGIASQLKRIAGHNSVLREIDVARALAWVQKELKIDLAENQKIAVQEAMKDKIHIITGGPGTGKSTITKAILAITHKLTDKVILTAPTGRAAKRMSEITGHPASTIHSLLEFNFQAGFKKNRENPLDADLIIVDESSMIDTSLMYSLLKAVPNRARLIFVGDIHQLPSVGPGNVLKDIISSKTIPVTTLNQIYRQAAGSLIVTNAHKINAGVFPDIHHCKDSDFFFIDKETPEDVLAAILLLVSQRLPTRYRFDPLQDIQVLAPMKKGVIGTENLNQMLQEKLNPGKAPLFRAGYKFLVGDKVMQIRNNYDKNVFNGDVGRIIEIDHIDQQMKIRFDDREISYDFSDLDEIVLAYAVSIHKYQGSECPCVVIPIHTTHFKMLHRNLLYTGVTRGKKIVVLVGNKKGLMIAVKNDEVRKRFTGLTQAIEEAFHG